LPKRFDEKMDINDKITTADEEQIQIDLTSIPTPDAEADAAAKQAEHAEEKIKETLEKIKQTASEEDPNPSSGKLNLRTILGGDLLTTQMVRSQIWLFVMIVAFSLVYVAFRYQCQQDMIKIDKLEEKLKDAKFKALSASSTLTAKSRESHVLEILKQNKDSLLHQADQPPYIIEVPE
jgi:cell division protein FtsL